MNAPDRRCYECDVILTKGKTFYHTHNGKFSWACPIHYISADVPPISNTKRHCRICKEPKPLDPQYFSPMPEGTKPTGANRINLMHICKGCEDQRGVI